MAGGDGKAQAEQAVGNALAQPTEHECIEHLRQRLLPVASCGTDEGAHAALNASQTLLNTSTAGATVRAEAATVAEHAGCASRTALRQALYTHSSLIRDEAPDVSKRALRSASVLFRKAFLVAALEPGNQDASELLRATNSLKDQIVTVTMTHKSSGVRVHAVKFVESVCALFTAGCGAGLLHDTTSDAYTCDGFDAAGTGGHEALVSQKGLLSEAEKLVGLLSSLTKPSNVEKLPGPLIITLIGALANLSRNRQQLVHKSLPPLLELGRSLSTEGANATAGDSNPDSSINNSSTITVASVRRSLCHWLLAILRSPSDAILNRRDVLCNALEDMGFEKDADAAIKQADRLRTISSSSGNECKEEEPSATSTMTVEAHGEPDAKPSEYEVWQQQSEQQKKPEQDQRQNNVPMDPLSVHQVYIAADELGSSFSSASFEALLQRFSHEAVVDFVLNSALHIPDEAPEASGAGIAFSSSGPPPNKRKKAGRGSTGKPAMAMLQDAMHTYGASAYIIKPTPQGSKQQSSVQSSAAAHGQQQQEYSLTAAITNASITTTSAPSGSVGKRKKVKIEAVRPGKAVQPLTSDGLKSLRTSAMQRISRTAPRGGWQLRSIFLSRLAAGCKAQVRASTEATMMNAIFQDFHEANGISLALQWLYSLYAAVAQEEQDFYPYYNYAFEHVSAEVQKRTTARDRSLMKLLVEAPHLPQSAFEKMRANVELDKSTTGESISIAETSQSQHSPEVGVHMSETDTNEDAVPKQAESDQQQQQQQSQLHRAERVALGLSTIRDVLFYRPGAREQCVEMLCEAAVHSDEIIRSRAARLLSTHVMHEEHLGSQHVLRFADEALQKAAHEQHEDACARLLPLVCIVCSQFPGKLRQVFEAHAIATDEARAAISNHLQRVLQTLGPTEEVLSIIVDYPSGSEHLSIEAARVLFDRFEHARSELHRHYKDLADRTSDARFLIPVLRQCSRNEALNLLPRLVCLKDEEFRQSIHRLVGTSGNAGPKAPLEATELLVALHNLQHQDSSISLKDVIEACNACFQMRSIFPPEVLSAAINQLVEQTPLPVVLMRSVIQALAVAPKLQNFLLEIAQRLVRRQIWREDSKLWDGFLLFMCKTLPESCSVLLALPPEQLQQAFASERFKKLRHHLQRFVHNNPTVENDVSSATLAAIGGNSSNNG